MKLTTQDIYKKKGKGKVTALTAYDHPFARILDEESLDIILVGDSVGMVMLGYGSTTPVTLEDMRHHAKAVAAAVKRSLVVVDMPYGSYASPEEALKNAKTLIEESGVDAVKLEGGTAVESQVKLLKANGIEVMGHVGMLPQSAHSPEDYRVHGKEAKEAEEIMEDAKVLDRLGAFAIVLECIPTALGRKITEAVKCPTIGIGAGPHTDGQVLVLHDMLGFGGSIHPKFVRRYGTLEKEVRSAVKLYCDDVQSGSYPSKEESYS